MGILAFLGGPWGALIQKGLIVVTIGIALWVAISQYNNHITQEQMLRDQNAQLVQLQKDNKDLQTKLDTLSKMNTDILNKLDTQNQKVVVAHDKVTTYIQSPEGQKSNRPSSDVIKKTIGMLRNE